MPTKISISSDTFSPVKSNTPKKYIQNIYNYHSRLEKDRLEGSETKKIPKFLINKRQ